MLLLNLIRRHVVKIWGLELHGFLTLSGHFHTKTALPAMEQTWYTLNRKQGRPENRSGRFGQEKNPCAWRISKTKSSFFQPVTRTAPSLYVELQTLLLRIFLKI